MSDKVNARAVVHASKKGRLRKPRIFSEVRDANIRGPANTTCNRNSSSEPLRLGTPRSLHLGAHRLQPARLSSVSAPTDMLDFLRRAEDCPPPPSLSHGGARARFMEGKNVRLVAVAVTSVAQAAIFEDGTIHPIGRFAGFDLVSQVGDGLKD